MRLNTNGSPYVGKTIIGKREPTDKTTPENVTAVRKQIESF